MPCLMLIPSHCELHTHIPTNVWYHLNNSEGQFKPKQLLNTIHGCIAYKKSIAIHFKCSILDLVLHTEWAHTRHARKHPYLYYLYNIKTMENRKKPFPIPYWYTWLTGHDDTFTIYIHISVANNGCSISAFNQRFFYVFWISEKRDFLLFFENVHYWLKWNFYVDFYSFVRWLKICGTLTADWSKMLTITIRTLYDGLALFLLS